MFVRRCLERACVNIIQVRGRRRTLTNPPWVPKKFKEIRSSLNNEDRKFMESELKGEIRPARAPFYKSVVIPSREVPDNSKNLYSFDGSKRVGLVARKIGMTLQWLNDGTRVLCTLLHVPDNQVVQTTDPESWYRRVIVGKRKAYGRHGPMWSMIIGALNEESIFYTDEYRRIFQRANVPCKRYLYGFVVSEDAVLPSGTSLDVRHFRVGQYVTVSGKTIDYGFQGVVRRWGMRGQPKLDTTKSHRRVGSIGSTGDAMVWPGRRLPGHMGYEWRHAHSLQVLRINPIKQVIYVKGCVPGDLDEPVLIKDTMIEEFRVRDPPFPTYVPEKEEHMPGDFPDIAARDLAIPNLFRFSQPSILYTEADETKSALRDKTRAKIAKVKK